MKKEAIIVALCLVIALAFGNVAMASTQYYTFWFHEIGEKQSTSAAPKSDSEQRAYVTTLNEKDSNMLPGDILGVRVRDYYDRYATSYGEITGYVQGYTLPYSERTGVATELYRLYGDFVNGKYNSLKVYGRWTP